MSGSEWGTLMRAIKTGASELGVALLIALKEMSVTDALLVTLGGLLLALLFAFFLQWTQKSFLKRKPEAHFSFLKLEFFTTAIGLVCLPFYLVWRLIVGVSNTLGAARDSKKDKKDEKQKSRDDGDAAEDADDSDAARAAAAAAAAEKKKEEEKEKEKEAKPFHAASIGPTFLLGGLYTAGLYVFLTLIEPILISQLNLTPDYSPWTYLTLGSSLELSWFIPLDRYPAMHWTLVFLFWLWAWWWISRIVRWANGGALGSSLIEVQEYNEADAKKYKTAYYHSPKEGLRGQLEKWPSWFALSNFSRPDDTYLEWAKWMPAVAVPLLGLSALALGGQVFQLPPDLMSVTVLLWFSWCLHLILRGHVPDPPEEPSKPKPTASARNGWPEVRDELMTSLHLDKPIASQPHRRIETEWSESSIDSPLISPLLKELAPSGSFSFMQRRIIETLTKQSFIHIEPPTETTDLEIKASANDGGPSDNSGMRTRNLLVLAPEGAGKTTLALLSASAQKLVHSQSTLIVVRDAATAESLTRTMQNSLNNSTLKWTMRLRDASTDLMSDLTIGIVPDIIVTHLEHLTIEILNDPDTYRPFLANLGLIIIDDVESYSGPVEVHAQLTFRRLKLRVQDLLNVTELGPNSMPQYLVLGSDSMHEQPSWVRSLVGVDVAMQSFGHNPSDEASIEESEAAAAGIDIDQENLDEKALKSSDRLFFQSFYRLNDFRTATHSKVRLVDVVEICERLSVPWHYRKAGDLGRALGRQPLLLRNEPRCFTADVEHASIVLIEGEWSEVRREVERIAYAGRKFSRIVKPTEDADLSNVPARVKLFEQIAVITHVDSDQDMAFTQVDPNDELTRLLETLPRPVVRPPIGLTIREHLASEIVSNWVEVKDIVDVFGAPTADTLRQLADDDLLLTRETTNVAADKANFQEEVYVRAMARALPRAVGTSPYMQGVAVATALPRPVSQVELASNHLLNLRDHTSLEVIDTVDGASAPLLYSAGSIFWNAKGRFVVQSNSAVEQSPGDELENADASPIQNDLMLEPFQNEEISSPRRRFRFELANAKARTIPSTGEQIATVTSKMGEEREPLCIGERGMEVLFGPAIVSCAHFGTYRLGPDFCEVRQRLLEPITRRRQVMQDQMRTEALFLFPEPEALEEGSEDRLTLREARLIAAAMRATLPSMYRGAADNLSVGIHIPTPAEQWQVGEVSEVSDDYPFGPNDAIVFFDLHEEGNGTARALHRDGLDLLLRLVRITLERVLYHDRLLAKFDHWADPSEMHGRRKRSSQDEVDTQPGETLDPGDDESGIQLDTSIEDGETDGVKEGAMEDAELSQDTDDALPPPLIEEASASTSAKISEMSEVDGAENTEEAEAEAEAEAENKDGDGDGDGDVATETETEPADGDAATEALDGDATSEESDLDDNGDGEELPQVDADTEPLGDEIDIEADEPDLAQALSDLMAESDDSNDMDDFEETTPAPPSDEAVSPPSIMELRRQEDEDRRHMALKWLDEHLRPEGGAAAAGAVGQYGSGMESGEGDQFDLGRCWYAEDGTVTNLIWTKHRWRDENRVDYALDFGVDRWTAAAARDIHPELEPLSAFVTALQDAGTEAAEQGEDDATSLSEAILGLPDTVLVSADGQAEPMTRAELIDSEAPDAALAELHSILSGLCAQAYPTLGNLYDTLSSRLDGANSYERAIHAVNFVQAIPTAVDEPVLNRPDSPLATAVKRSGNPLAKALLLSILADYGDLTTGLFVSIEENTCFPAIGVTGISGPNLSAWSDATGQSVPPRFFANAMSKSGNSEMVVPVDMSGQRALGDVAVQKVESYVFLPLSEVFELWCRPESVRPNGEKIIPRKEKAE